MYDIIEEADTMLDLKFVRENLELVKQNLDNRHTKGDLDTFVAAYDERKQLIQKVEELKALRNSVTEEISQLKRNKENADDKIAAMQTLSAEVKALDTELAEIDAKVRRMDECYQGYAGFPRISICT